MASWAPGPASFSLPDLRVVLEDERAQNAALDNQVLVPYEPTTGHVQDLTRDTNGLDTLVMLLRHLQAGIARVHREDTAGQPAGPEGSFAAQEAFFPVLRLAWSFLDDTPDGLLEQSSARRAILRYMRLPRGAETSFYELWRGEFMCRTVLRRGTFQLYSWDHLRSQPLSQPETGRWMRVNTSQADPMTLARRALVSWDCRLPLEDAVRSLFGVVDRPNLNRRFYYPFGHPAVLTVAFHSLDGTERAREERHGFAALSTLLVRLDDEVVPYRLTAVVRLRDHQWPGDLLRRYDCCGDPVAEPDNFHLRDTGWHLHDEDTDFMLFYARSMTTTLRGMPPQEVVNPLPSLNLRGPAATA